MAVGYAAWAHSVQDVADHYRVDLQDGLTEDQVTAAREEYGRNELEKQPGKPLWKLVLEQFDDMLVKVSCRRQQFALCQIPPETACSSEIACTGPSSGGPGVLCSGIL